MPNWCENRLAVAGPREKLLAFAERMRVSDGESPTDFSLARYKPTPPEALADQRPETGVPQWYDWRLKHWGCKWDVTATLVADEDDHLVYVFDSPWGPPDKAIRGLIVEHPELAFALNFEETGNGFHGKIRGYGGNILEDFVEDLTALGDVADDALGLVP